MLLIWTKAKPSKTLDNLCHVLKSAPDLPVEIVSDFSIPEGTKTILALGKEPLLRLQEEKVIAKNRTTTSCRTIPHMRQGLPVLVSYSPDIGEVDHRYYIDLLTDVTLAMRYCLTGTWKPVYGKYRYVPDFSELIAQIEQKYAEMQKPIDLCKDLETVGLDPYAQPILPSYPGGYIVTMQATCQAGTADVVRFGSRGEEEETLKKIEFRDQLDYLLNSPKISLKGANFKFDLHWLWVRAKMKCSNFKFDTTIVGSLLDENRSNSLDVHTKIYVPNLAGYADSFNKEVDKSRMDKVPPATLLPYAGGDVDAGLQVAAAEKQQLLQDPKLAGFYVNILHPAARAFEDIEQGGVFLDMDAYQELKLDLEKAHVELVTKACKIMGGRIVAKHQDASKPGGMNLTKASMLCDFLFSPMGLNLKPKMFTAKPDKDGNQKPSTASEHLEMFAEHPEAKEFIAIIQEDAQVMKTYTTYVVGFMQHIRSDGRFHPTYYLFVGDKDEGEGGATTGRLSCHDPAFQTVPKHTKWAKRIRKIFKAPAGWVILERDYSQGELRVIACIANETNMIAAYKAGHDLHAKTAAGFSGYTYDSLIALEATDEATFSSVRQLGKAGNFGLVFGMQAVPGFQNYARRNYGVTLTEDQAVSFREGFFATYPQLLVYHDEYKRFARKYKHVRTPLGRVRHLPLIDSPNKEQKNKAERQSINSPVQGTLTDMMLWAIALEHQEGLHKIAPCFGSVHDAVYNYCPEDQVDKVVRRQLAIMENLPFEKVGWKPQLRFIADAKFGPNMADLAKFKRR